MRNIKGFFLMGVLLFCASCGSGSSGNSVNRGGEVYDITPSNSYYTDKDGHTWYRSNIYAPGPNESMNDESYKRRWKRTPSDPYSEGYDAGYEEGYRDGESNSN